jgi:insertion element IS1 protein InsB
LLERLCAFDVKIYYADNFDVYPLLIPPEMLIQTKKETHGIERNNAPQRHWFARFRRRTCVVSRSVEMVDLTCALYAWFHSKEGKRRLFDLRIAIS